jgi:hypothetical protein
VSLSLPLASGLAFSSDLNFLGRAQPLQSPALAALTERDGGRLDQGRPGIGPSFGLMSAL